MLKGIDLQMLAFVGGSLLQEYVRLIHIPKMYYWAVTENEEDDEDDRAA